MDSGSWQKHVVTAEKGTSAVVRAVGATRSWRILARRNGCPGETVARRRRAT